MAAADVDWEMVSSCGSPAAEAGATHDLQALEEAMAGAGMDTGFEAVSGSSDEEERGDEEAAIAMEEEERERRMEEETEEEEEDDDDDDDDGGGGMYGTQAASSAPARPGLPQAAASPSASTPPGLQQAASSPSSSTPPGLPHESSSSTTTTTWGLLRRGLGYASWVLVRWAGMMTWPATAAAFGILLLVACGWRRIHTRNRKLQALIWAKDKELSQLAFQVMQLKDTLASGRRIPVVVSTKPPSLLPYGSSS